MNGKIFLIHWKEAEAEDYALDLRSKGWNVAFESEDGARAWKRIIEQPPDIILIFLSRLPSHGRETAHYLRSLKATQVIPIVFIDGSGEALQKTRAKVPDALYITGGELDRVLTQFSTAEVTPHQKDQYTFHPLTLDRWPDLVALFGPRGACGGCWCMWWRIKRSEFDLQKGDGNRQALQAIVASGDVPGILAYEGELPVGWCSVAPREAFPVLERSRILKRVDDQPVWSVVCFFVAKNYRRQGLTVRLLEAAVDYARGQGATIVEGYPEEPRSGRAPDPFVFTGLASAFRQAGFVEVLRRSETRPIMRYTIEPAPE